MNTGYSYEIRQTLSGIVIKSHAEVLYSVILVKIARGREFGKSCFILDFACHTITMFKLLKIFSAKHGESK